MHVRMLCDLWKSGLSTNLYYYDIVFLSVNLFTGVAPHCCYIIPSGYRALTPPSLEATEFAVVWLLRTCFASE